MKHFYHPDAGYWVTLTDEIPQSIRDKWPDGTLEVTERPDQFHDWVNNDWVLNTTRQTEVMSVDVRAERDAILQRVVDPIVSNTLRWNDLTTEKQNEWTAYRTALLNISDQEGFPTNVTWPTQPE